MSVLVRNTYWVVANLALFLSVAGGAHGPQENKPSGPPLDVSQTLKSFKIAKEHYAIGPDVRDIGAVTFSDEKVDLLIADDLPPEWKRSLNMVAEVVKELSEEFPEAVGNLPIDFSVVPETRFERGSGGIYPQHLHNRNLLKLRLLQSLLGQVEISRKQAFLASLKQSPDLSIAPEKLNWVGQDDSARLMALAHLATKDQLQGTEYQTVLGAKASADNVGRYAYQLKRARFYEKDFPKLAKYLHFRAEKYRISDELDQRHPNAPDAAAISTHITHLIAELSDRSKQRNLKQGWRDFLRVAVNDPQYYRALRHQGVVYNAEPKLSMAALLEGFERTLSPDTQDIFRQLRKEHLLDPASLNLEEALSTHRALVFDARDAESQWIGVLKEKGLERVYATVPPGFAERDKKAAEQSAKLHNSQGDLAQNLRKVIDTNDFEVGRGLIQYSDRLGNRFLSDVLALTKEDHWIDMGSGEGIALEEYHALHAISPDDRDLLKGEKYSQTKKLMEAVVAKPANEKARATGVTKTMNRKNPPSFQGRVNHLTDRYLEEIPDKELGKAKLITDVFGVMAYAPQIDEVLNTYSRLLTDDGRALITGVPSTAVILKDGSRIDFKEWVRKNAGGKAEVSENTLIIRGGAHRWPALVLESSDQGSPPKRVYREKE